MHTNKGDMRFELLAGVAPMHVTSTIYLTRLGFYDDTVFHRIIPNFVIQGGCPRGDGTGGPGWNVNAEFNDREHHPGTLSMARSSDPNSAGSQFFICLTREHCQHLDRNYTGFGQVIDGMDVVEKLGAVKCDGSDRPIETVKMVSVRAMAGA